jgi:hypothetical protein
MVSTGSAFHSTLVAAFAAASVIVSADQNPAALSRECGDWRDCRDRTNEALTAKAYETAHDLAWRAVQKGPPNDPDLFFLLARTQSMGGRATPWSCCGAWPRPSRRSSATPKATRISSRCGISTRGPTSRG